ncbi:arylesterase [Pseudoblastomonas halimionae]|uniref:Arylesterase n=1 Tax=Alteriqipengyuania halimionae TaxID=1926630 RepID=A0A6I4U6M8_9SPHN|nr:arylesterase [Alteriqipengyuania halimionae]MXP10081.1 arylesterase [Alteriqipengyuania halimionae]
MKRILVSTSALLLLVGCGSSDDNSTQPVPPESARTERPGKQVDPQGEPVQILAFGDSLFAGYGVESDESYPAQLEAALRERGINASVANAGVSGDTTQAGRDRLAFTIEAQTTAPDLLIVELGGNDMLRGIEPEQTRSNVKRMLEIAQEKGVPVLLFGMRAPPNMGKDYVRQYDAIYGDLAKEYGVPLVPFFLESIYQDPENFQDDRVHPTPAAIGTLVDATIDQIIGAFPKELTDNLSVNAE